MRIHIGANSPPAVAVVGGGFSGLLTALHLLREHPSVTVHLIERSSSLGRGRAYGASNPDHLLNVRAANMSAFPDRPDHFLSWLNEADGDAFVSRSRYGDYLQSLLEWEIGDPRQDRRLIRQFGEVVAAARETDGWRIRLADGRSLAADALVLAVGFLAPRFPAPVEANALCIADPWSADLTRLPQGDVLLVGAGLTMVDVALSLAGPHRRLTALSRRGLLSLSHAPTSAQPPPDSDLSSPLAALRALRAHAEAVGWREAVDSVRPATAAVWARWTLADRRQFLRHLRPWWDIHRHRMAPAVAGRIASLRSAGTLTVQAGRLESARVIDGQVEARIRPRGGAATTRRFAAVVNCASPQSDPASDRNGVVADLWAQGLLRADPLKLGIEVDAGLTAIGSAGTASAGLFAVGPLTRGLSWETVAVPDLRLQTRQAARSVLAYLRDADGAGPLKPAPPVHAAEERRAGSQAQFADPA